ncbi:MAG: asparaginase [Clostridia bacterium]|jgi:L-asparaginase II|nr:asparaginase [Clostridia bacterium]
MDSAILAEVTRGGITESVHRGIIAVVDAAGRNIAWAGNPTELTFMRSGAKPLQALTVLETGAAERFGLIPEELALMMASHSGEDEHVRIGRQLMSKLGLDETTLQCGTHTPLHKETANRLKAAGQAPGVYHCVCSGKHGGMLAVAKHLGFSVEGYFLPEHPVQRLMLETIADLAGLPVSAIRRGSDGCGVPVFGMPVETMAYMYARWADPSSLETPRQKACYALQEAMIGYPRVIAGTGRFTTHLLQETGRKFLAKDGNEGIFCVGVPEKGWGIVLKIEDGSARAVNPVIIETLRQLDLLTEEEYARLSRQARPELYNYRKETVGEIRPVFRLARQGKDT